MAKLRSGPIFTQEILTDLINAVESFSESDEHPDPDATFKRMSQCLQKFLHHGMSRFSAETLQSVIDDLVASNTGEGEEALDIKSLTQLRRVVKMTMTRRDSGSLRASDATALKFVETFFYCLYCLSEAKRMFDKVFDTLYFAYFNPDGVSRQSTKVPSAVPKDRSSNGEHVEDYSQFGISTLQQMTGSTQHKLRHTVRDMKEVLDRWTELLTDEEPDASSFDPESEQDLHLLHGVSGSEPVLRLVPDLFAKYYKCMELTKQWWVLALDAYPGVPFKRRTPEADDTDVSRASSSGGDSNSRLSDKNEVTSDEIEATKQLVTESQKEIESLQEEIEALDKREEKFEILKETYEKVGKEIDDKKKEQKRLRIEREQLNPDENKEDLLIIEHNLNLLDSKVRLLEFQHALLLEDFVIHLEIRPSIIRFQDDAKVHLRDAELTRQKHMEHLHKLREPDNFPSTVREAVSQEERDSFPEIKPSVSNSQNNLNASSPTNNEGQNIAPKVRLKQTATFTVDENKKTNNQRSRKHKDSLSEKSNQISNPVKNESVKPRYTVRTNNSKQSEEAQIVASNSGKENQKSEILKRANNKPESDSVNLSHNAVSKTVVKKGFGDKGEMGDNLRKTYDLSDKPKTRIGNKQGPKVDNAEERSQEARIKPQARKTSVPTKESGIGLSKGDPKSRRKSEGHLETGTATQHTQPKVPESKRRTKEGPTPTTDKISKKSQAPANNILLKAQGAASK